MMAPERYHPLQELVQNRETYPGPREDIRRELGNRSLVMLVGPAAIGKTFLMERVAELDKRFGLASSITTRPPAERDPSGLFRYYDQDTDGIELLEKYTHRDFINYAIHPTELTLYGNELEDVPYEHNMLATLSGAVDQLRGRGFGETHVIGLTTSPGDWLTWFNHRYKNIDATRFRRLGEAEKSYRDLLKRDDVTWVVNRENDVDGSAAELIEAVDNHPRHEEEALAYVHRILQLIPVERERAYENND